VPALIALVDGDTAVYRTCFGKGQQKIGDQVYRTTFIEVVEAMDNYLFWIQELFERPPRVFLTTLGTDNFRYNIATIKPYKGNRDSTKRPFFHADLREYLVNEWNAVVSQGCEADDLLASAHNSGTVIVTIDKDLAQVPGYNFNPVKNELRLISEQEAWFNFYVSMLIGDTADNITGLDGIGKVKAPKLLESQNKLEMEFTVLNLYKNHAPKGIKQYENGEEAFEEVRQLLWLKRDIRV
jgi:5'-3' exonuclease